MSLVARSEKGWRERAGAHLGGCYCSLSKRYEAAQGDRKVKDWADSGGLVKSTAFDHCLDVRSEGQGRSTMIQNSPVGVSGNLSGVMNRNRKVR